VPVPTGDTGGWPVGFGTGVHRPAELRSDVASATPADLLDGVTDATATEGGRAERLQY
jgi:hypothetical protein